MLRCWHYRSAFHAGATARLRSHFHTIAIRNSSHESIEVPCSSNGSISLDVYHPQEPSRTESLSVVIFLPRGPILQNEAHDDSNIATLRDVLSCHIVKIDYRCSGSHRFPTPVHDVLVGYDWIINNLLPKRAITRPGRPEHVGRLAACGELLGGTLALSLGLSECRIGEAGIAATAASNPIVDWTAVHDYGRTLSKQQQRAYAGSGLTAETLTSQREILFRRPAHYFDPFASPIHFFRSAGLEVPEYVEPRPLDEMEELIRFKREESLREQLAFGAQLNAAEPDGTEPAKKRKVSRRFPSTALGLRLPYFRIESGSQAIVSGQAIELTHQLRQSFERQCKPGPSRRDSFRSVYNEMERDASDDPVQHCWSLGLGLWDDSQAGKARMQETAKWLRQKLAV